MNVDESDLEPGHYHVLIVDDTDDERRALARLVRNEGYEVSEAESGRQALELLAETPVNMVVTELLMPDIDGWELLARVKKQYPQTHVVVITGSVNALGEAILTTNKADGYLIKPVIPKRLMVLLRALLYPQNLDRTSEVAVVDADRTSREHIDAVLSGRGVFVQTYESARMAFPRIKADPPDLVITELGANGEGFVLCESIRARRNMPYIPILVVTGAATPGNVNRALRMRVNGLILKPYSDDELASRVMLLLRQSIIGVKKPAGH